MSSGRSNVALFAVVAAALVAQPARANETGPTMVVWAWHRNGSLESLSPDRFEVAFLARTLTLQSGGVAIAHRRSPVRVAPGTRLTAVVRIERDPALSADSAQRWLAETRDAVLGAHARAHTALQIDFDAPRSFRPFYRALLAQIRATLPRTTRLSMTALGSWCTGDRWMHDLPADEIVPMLFTMGRGGAPVHRVLAATATLPEPRCRASVGVSLHERLPRIPDARRVYVWGAPNHPSARQILRIVGDRRVTLAP